MRGVLHRRPAGWATRGRRCLIDTERCDPWPAGGRPGLRRDGTRALAAAPDTGRNVGPGPRRVRATGTTIAGRGGVPARAFRATTVRRHPGRRECEPGRLLYIEQSCYLLLVR